MDIEAFIQKFGRKPEEFVLEQFRRRFDFVLLGEQVGEIVSHTSITALIPHLPEGHALYLDVSASFQPAIDAFLTGNETASNLLRGKERTLISKGKIITVPIVDAYLDILRVARERRIPVIAIGIEPTIDLKGNLEPSTRERYAADYIMEKDRHMAYHIRGTHGLIYTTNWHITRHAPASLASLLRNSEKRCYAITVEGSAEMTTNSSESAGFTAGIHNYLQGNAIAFHLGSQEFRDGMDQISRERKDIRNNPQHPTIYTCFDGFIYHPNP